MRLVVAALVMLLAAACSSRADDPGTTTASLTGAASREPSRTATATPTATPDLGPAAFDTVNAMAHARVLSVDIGERVAGSEAERQAAEYIREQFAASGYAAEVEAFVFEGSRFTTATIVTGETTIDARPIQGSRGSEVEGPVVYVRLARPEDLTGIALEGAIAVADRGEIEFREKFRNVRDAGAVGLIVINTEEQLLPGATLGDSVDAPVIGIRASDGVALRTAAAAGLTASINAESSETESVNVMAKAPGTDRCVILVGGHHDTVPDAPGANDNASGVGHVLELARAFAADGLDEGLCFATFGGEESGLFGSRAMAAALAESDALPGAMVNFDVTGVGARPEAIGSPDLVESAIDAAAEEGVTVVASALPPNSGSDHQSFEEAGVPVLFLTSGSFDTIHTPGDVYRDLTAAAFEPIGVAGHASIRALYGELAAP